MLNQKNICFKVLQSAINNLDNLTSLDSILDNLGRRHGKLESSSGFRKCYWTTFLECAIYHLRLTMEKPSKKKQQTMTPDEIDEAIVLWRILLRNVIDRIEVTFRSQNSVKNIFRLVTKKIFRIV